MNGIHKAKHAVEKSADRANSLLDEATNRVTGFVDDAKDKGEELIDDAQERSQDAWKDLKKWVQKNPGTALGWGLAAGAFLYAVFTRKDD